MENKSMAMAAAFRNALRAKDIFRRQQAKLPFESKIDILIRMQKLAAQIGKAAGRKQTGKVWMVTNKKESHRKI
jgi:hypothetical protein